ncbi:unnamed protein product [Rotaria sordida]|nr:unnamed protein product [Rotaria sordida]CAF4110551.1 unnamed protein product [Rotaria sordida]
MRCDDYIPENEMTNHQKNSCVLSLPSVNVPEHKIRFIPCNYCHKKYPVDMIENHQTSCTMKRKPVESSKTLYDYSSCIYCDESYPDNLIQKHQLVCHQRPISPPVITIEPVSLYVKCDNCKTEFLHNKLADHQRTCSLEHPTGNNTYNSPKFIQCQHCNKQFPLHRIDAHEESCPTKSRSFLASICPCFSFFRSKNY